MTDLSPLTPADIPEVMRIERTPGYDAVVGRFEADEHAAQMASPTVRYVGIRDGDGLAGFVILQTFDQPTVLLRRIAVSEVERGVGSRLVREVTDWVFQTTPAIALRLEVSVNNPRARHVYEREGFREYDADAVHHFMRIPRERWADLRDLGA
ncbi:MULTISPECIES: GNAT family N-acetyltransferase [unclassified Phenylobacterium]|uniref:GNAT family N-acetyltransferase n=1 Tax=unclassified Phenylobacterium TaxID=2640670 RepID=UPI00083B92B6|nr:MULTISPECIES: GNAT family N-acetyltransferase [unclassified Phenylobacterium]